MSKAKKNWLIAAAVLVAAGLLLFAAVMTVNHWDFSKLGTAEYETYTYKITEDFRSIEIYTETADLLFAVSEDGACRVDFYVPESVTHSAEVKNGTLTVQTSEKNWNMEFGIHYQSPKVTVYLPKTAYALLSVEETTGDIEIPKEFQFESVDISLSTGDVGFCASASGAVNITATTGAITVEHGTVGALALSASTGEITVSGVTCQNELTANVTTGTVTVTDTACRNLVSYGTTGEVFLTRMLAAGKITVERSTGDVRFEAADAAELFVKTATGDVSGTLLTEKIFFAESSTGSIRVPRTTTGGTCEITTSTGDILIEIAK